MKLPQTIQTQAKIIFLLLHFLFCFIISVIRMSFYSIITKISWIFYKIIIKCFHDVVVLLKKQADIPYQISA